MTTPPTVIPFGDLVAGDTIRSQPIFDLTYRDPEVLVSFGNGKNLRVKKLHEIVPPAVKSDLTPQEIAKLLRTMSERLKDEAEHAKALAQDEKDQKRRDEVANRKAKLEENLAKKRERKVERKADALQAQHDTEVLRTANKQMEKKDAEDVEEAMHYTPAEFVQEVNDITAAHKRHRKEDLRDAARSRASASTRGSMASAAPAPAATAAATAAAAAAPPAAAPAAARAASVPFTSFVPQNTPTRDERAQHVGEWKDEVRTFSPIPTVELDSSNADSKTSTSSEADSSEKNHGSEASSGAGPATPAKSTGGFWQSYFGL